MALLLMALFLSGIFFTAHAQIVQAAIGVNGLTCSQCTRSVKMELLKLPFVRQVKMNLEHTSGIVYFKNGKKIKLDKIAQAIRDAGFSTRFVNVTFNLSKISTDKNCFTWDHNVFYFLSPLSDQHPDKMTFQIIGKGFLSRRNLRKYSLKPTGACTAKNTYYLKVVKS